jgi:hypothetical protein
MTDLIALAERCETAEGSQQGELLWEAFYAVHGEPLVADTYGDAGKRAYIAAESRFIRLVNAEAFLDAAMTLAPRGSAALVLKQANEACLRAVAFRSDDFLRQLPCFVSAAALRARASMETPK